MRILAATLVPLLILGGLELGLRLGGYGYPTSLFLPNSIQGREYLIPNHKFSYRFFPPALAREPVLFRMPAEKPEGTYRIFLFGESAALGDPDPAYGLGRHLEVLLEAYYPSANVEVICVAMTAINSHVILPIARECARHDGDLWVIYMGNNEMVGPFGAGTVFGTRAPHRTIVRSLLALKTTRLGQLLDTVLKRLQGNPTAPDSWHGINMFTRNPLRQDDAARLRSYANFEANLEDMLRAGAAADVPILISTVGSNLRDCSPFASLHAADLAPDRLAEWERLYQDGIAFEKNGASEAALNAYSNAAAIDPQFAELQFRMGKCHLALTNAVGALQAFERARDYDVLAVRADTRINAIIQDTAMRQPTGKVITLDVTQALAQDSPNGIPGRDLFYDHVHYTLEGNHQLARIFAERIVALPPPEFADIATEAWIDKENCNRHLAATVWDQGRLWTTVQQRIAVPPFTTQTSHEANLRHCETRFQELLTEITVETSKQLGRQTYEEALSKDPDDILLTGNFAQFLEMIGSRNEAIHQGRRLCHLLPDHPWPQYYVGLLLVKDERLKEAAQHFQQALDLRSDFTRAHDQLHRIRVSHPSLVDDGR